LSTTCESLKGKSDLVCTNANSKKLEELQEVLKALLEKGLRRGFFGVLAIEVDVEDGTIQQIEERIVRRHR
jgi:alcohol dehydrogenase class IV